MANPLIHPTTNAQIDHMLADFPHAVLLQGPMGVGLTGIATYIADALQAVTTTVLPEKQEKIDIEHGVIAVDSIRRLYDQTKTKLIGRRLIVIDYAERMGIQAQNAFLKLLEEPGEGTHFILLAHETTQLLPTIHSRVQTVEVRPITRQQSEALLDTLKVTDATIRSQLLFIADGRPAEITRLATDKDAFQARASLIRDARTLLQGDAYDKLAVIQYYKDDRAASLVLVSDAMNMLRTSMMTNPTSATISKMKALLEAYERLQANGNLRLQLAAFVV